jgi:hypothetical protein
MYKSHTSEPLRLIVQNLLHASYGCENHAQTCIAHRTLSDPILGFGPFKVSGITAFGLNQERHPGLMPIRNSHPDAKG